MNQDSESKKMTPQMVGLALTSFVHGGSFGGTIPGGPASMHYQFRGSRLIVVIDLLEALAMYQRDTSSSGSGSQISMRDTQPELLVLSTRTRTRTLRKTLRT